MINFVGVGSAFHPQLGNNSAYLYKGDSLLLIDCGGTIFGRLLHKGLLKGIKNLSILITHPHPDHIGSLGDLIFYSYYKLHITPTLFFPVGEWLTNYFTSVGVSKDKYIINERMAPHWVDPQFGTLTVNFFPVTHSESIPCFGFTITRAGSTIYYSGDASKIPQQVLEDFGSGKIQRIYQDTSGADYPDNPHLSLPRLEALIPPERREKVTCMHLDEGFDRAKAKALGFAVAEEGK